MDPALILALLCDVYRNAREAGDRAANVEQVLRSVLADDPSDEQLADLRAQLGIVPPAGAPDSDPLDVSLEQLRRQHPDALDLAQAESDK